MMLLPNPSNIESSLIMITLLAIRPFFNLIYFVSSYMCMGYCFFLDSSFMILVLGILNKYRFSIAVGKEELPMPYLLYLQGGPGFECPRPTEASGWIQKACEEFRVVLMDQAWLLLITFEQRHFKYKQLLS